MREALQVSHCCACFALYPERKYIDFEAAYDGPVVSDEETGIKVAIDDLILCDECLRKAAELVGMIHAEDIKAENKELGEAVEAKDEELEELKELVNDQEATIKQHIDSEYKIPWRKPKVLIAK